MPTRAIVLADGELLFDGAPRGAAARRRRAAARRPRARRSSRSCERARATGAMSWLLRKDLLILRRSRLLVGVLVVYPVAIALLIGLAISRGPGKPQVAIVDETPPGADGRRWAASGCRSSQLRRAALQPGAAGRACRRARRRSRRSSRARCSRRS